MELSRVLETVGGAVDVVGVAVIVVGAAVASWVAVQSWRRSAAALIYERYRRDLGRSILLGLEFLVAADIIKTVAVTPTFTSVGVLAVIVLIRTFLSWSLQLEISGRWPWQNGRTGPPAEESPVS
ncbi:MULTISPECIES: DUF1622 domain-containing protein [unclassified Rhodococcus (in: high G+C Gram-positive bacteria)]|uniref:DUF1622 domain-containing protein n=1 Tax=unclassified Rhodococcus (in: high G+C Gram-positive bacteria) TaxID=192944 RepID=UPI0009266725|nr:DUF1622 domain-containing protein [Rhodococcus sp. M8]OLL17735.1 hypothetical protein BKE56_021090 [Rhodococcus sp. M8]QPG46006.1 DUF1622 domain-containing protein [Rhodococcus sp. M8]